MILFREVVKRFDADTPAVDNLSFDIDEGELVFLTGPSGSGKTSILRLLTREYIPTSGEIEFEGTPLSRFKKNVHIHRRKIGVVFQDYRLLGEYNIWENVALPLYIAGKKQSAIEQRVTELLDLVGLTDKAFLFPHQLSGGESQRISIARAVSTAPHVILADEPTGNLDAHNTHLIVKLLTTINKHGTTVLFATHDMDVLASSPHRQIHLEKGKIVKDTKKPKETGEAPTPQEHTSSEPKTEKAPDSEKNTSAATRENTAAAAGGNTTAAERDTSLENESAKHTSSERESSNKESLNIDISPKETLLKEEEKVAVTVETL